MEFFFTLQVDCESTQRTIANPGLGEILAEAGLKATFVVIPPDLKAHGAIYHELEAQGHEVGCTRTRQSKGTRSSWECTALRTSGASSASGWKTRR
jgi:hypothetical protein